MRPIKRPTVALALWLGWSVVARAASSGDTTIGLRLVAVSMLEAEWCCFALASTEWGAKKATAHRDAETNEIGRNEVIICMISAGTEKPFGRVRKPARGALAALGVR